MKSYAINLDDVQNLNADSFGNPLHSGDICYVLATDKWCYVKLRCLITFDAFIAWLTGKKKFNVVEDDMSSRIRNLNKAYLTEIYIVKVTYKSTMKELEQLYDFTGCAKSGLKIVFDDGMIDLGSNVLGDDVQCLVDVLGRNLYLGDFVCWYEGGTQALELGIVVSDKCVFTRKLYIMSRGAVYKLTNELMTDVLKQEKSRLTAIYNNVYKHTTHKLGDIASYACSVYSSLYTHLGICLNNSIIMITVDGVSRKIETKGQTWLCITDQIYNINDIDSYLGGNPVFLDSLDKSLFGIAHNIWNKDISTCYESSITKAFERDAISNIIHLGHYNLTNFKYKTKHHGKTIQIEFFGK